MVIQQQQPPPRAASECSSAAASTDSSTSRVPRQRRPRLVRKERSVRNAPERAILKQQSESLRQLLQKQTQTSQGKRASRRMMRNLRRTTYAANNNKRSTNNAGGIGGLAAAAATATDALQSFVTTTTDGGGTTVQSGCSTTAAEADEPEQPTVMIPPSPPQESPYPSIYNKSNNKSQRNSALSCDSLGNVVEGERNEHEHNFDPAHEQIIMDFGGIDLDEQRRALEAYNEQAQKARSIDTTGFASSDDDSSFHSNDFSLVLDDEDDDEIPITIEVSPGERLPLRGTKDTVKCILRGDITVASCMSCDTDLHCVTRDVFVVCPECWAVSPIILDMEHGPTGATQDKAATVCLGMKANEVMQHMNDHLDKLERNATERS